MKRLTILFLLLGQLVFAQEKQMSLEDAIIGRYSYLSTESSGGLLWRTDKDYTYVSGDSVLNVQAKNGKEEVLFTLNLLETITGENFRGLPRFSWQSADEILLRNLNKYLLIDVTEGTIKTKIEFPADAVVTEYTNEGGYVVFVQEDDLFLVDETGSIKSITNDGGEGIVYGQSVHRNEFGISGGIFISPKANYVAFYRKDESMVKDYPLVDFMAREAEYKPVKYPMAGMDSHHVTVGIYNVETQETIYLKTGEPLDHYLTNIAWSPDEENIYLAELNREQNHMTFNSYDVESGDKVKTLFEEKAETYVEPLFPIQFSKINPDEFYYLSRQDGWFHVYKYNNSGDLVQQITKGDWEVTSLVGFDAEEKFMFVEGTRLDPLQNHIYSVEIKTGELVKLSVSNGLHHARLSPSGTYILDIWNHTNTPSAVDLLSTKGKLVRTVFTAKDPLADYQLGENKLVTLKTKDGKYDLHGRLILPNNFDRSKKYPVIVYVYGGPHSQLVTKSWQNQARWWQYYMASQGYIAFTLDNRGTNNRGRAFETAVHRQLGVLETQDQMQGIEYLKSLPYVDADRIGVHGWSYGGFMTLNLMLRHPATFKVGVAGGPVVDWSMYEIMYGERYMDMPQENPIGYEESNMINHMDKLNGKLMLIHGVQDATVVMQHSMKFLRESVRQGKQVDFFAYPTHPHNVKGKDRVHLMEKVSNYFFENL